MGIMTVFDATALAGARTSKEKVGSLVGGGINVAALAAAIAWLLGAFGVALPEGGETSIIMPLLVAGIALAGAIKNAVAWIARERASREALQQAAIAAQVQHEIQKLKLATPQV